MPYIPMMFDEFLVYHNHSKNWMVSKDLLLNPFCPFWGFWGLNFDSSPYQGHIEVYLVGINDYYNGLDEFVLHILCNLRKR